MIPPAPALVFAGAVRREFFLLPDGKALPGILGGPALYAAAGAKIWTADQIGIVARAGGDFPVELLEKIRSAGLDPSGIRTNSGWPPAYEFIHFESWDQPAGWDPAKQFAKHHLPCPRELFNYRPPALEEGSIRHFSENAVRREDLPPRYREVRAAGILPCHYRSQIMLSVGLRESGATYLLLSPPEGLLLPLHRAQVCELLHGIQIAFFREGPLRKLVDDRRNSLERISETISRWGPKIILIQEEMHGIHSYDSESGHAAFTPFYPTELKNPPAVGFSFCGGFLAAWRKTYHLAESVLHGCISASLAGEGFGGLYALERTPGLAEARLASLRRSLPGGNLPAGD
jgi:sugar/nucleoside kinase (ribokinase family)